MSITAVAKKIRLLILDVDGVLTDGKITVNHDGSESLSFHVQDGLGIQMLQKSGVTVAVISGRDAPASKHRLEYLKIQYIFLGHFDKMGAFESLKKILGVSCEEIAYMGDDLPDMPVMEKIGLPIAVANALDPVKKIARFCTQKNGGEGAVREVCDLIMAAQRDEI